MILLQTLTTRQLEIKYEQVYNVDTSKYDEWPCLGRY